MSGSLNFVELFAGAGGLSEGFIQDGFQPVAFVESDAAACNTLRTRLAFHWLKRRGRQEMYADYLEGLIDRASLYASIPEATLNSIIRHELKWDNIGVVFKQVDTLLKGRKLDLLVGGPPCQAYSVIGRSRDPQGMMFDSRNYLYFCYGEFLKNYRPRRFVFENVVGLLSAKDLRGNNHFCNIQKLFQKIGYQTTYFVLNANDVGVLQNRKRLVLVGCLESVPNKDFVPSVANSNAIVQDALSDLPPLSAGEGTPRPCKLLSNRAPWLNDAKIKTSLPVTWHQARPQTQRDLEIYRIAVSKWNDSRSRLKYDCLPYSLKTHRNKTAFTDRFKVVAGELPFAQTVVAHICKDGHYYIHPDGDQNRSITPREAARLQTFPDDYYFEGVRTSPSRTSAFRQIGNAVPVLLSRRIAASIRESWDG